MEAEWIKMRAGITKDPKVLAMANYLSTRPHFVKWFGLPPEMVTDRNVTRNVTVRVTVTSLLNVWSNANRSGKADGEDLVVEFANLDTLEDWAEHPAFGEAMVHVGWAREEDREGGGRLVRFPKFLLNNVPVNERHKKLNADRQKKFRERHRYNGVTGNAGSNDDSNVTRNVTVTHREDKIREDIKTPPIPPRGGIEPAPTESPKKRKGSRVALLDDADFQRFWSAYPNPKNKAEAFKAWQKLRPDEATIALLLQAVERQKQSRDWQQEGGRFIPYPASWLNGRRWEDGAPAPLPAAPAAPDPAAKAAYDTFALA
jgi:hypothetical protein